jgi:hypothetical protein
MNVPTDGSQVWKIKAQSRYSLEVGISDEEKWPKGIVVCPISCQWSCGIKRQASTDGSQVWKVKAQTWRFAITFNVTGIYESQIAQGWVPLWHNMNDRDLTAA